MLDLSNATVEAIMVGIDLVERKFVRVLGAALFGRGKFAHHAFVVEVSRRCVSVGQLDRFGGLAWEVEDVAAMHARLLEGGFDVSELRVGHKAGTRVCTVRSRTHGVATLLKGPENG